MEPATSRTAPRRRVGAAPLFVLAVLGGCAATESPRAIDASPAATTAGGESGTPPDTTSSDTTPDSTTPDTTPDPTTPDTTPGAATSEAVTVPDPDVGASTDPNPSRSTSVGDPRYPELGSADLDVLDYVLDAAYLPDPPRLTGTVTIDTEIERTTDRIALDTDGPDVSEVRVDGTTADFDLVDGELLITLDEIASVGDRLSVEVDFRTLIVGRQFFADGAGLFPNGDGLWSVNEPDGASTWMPVNDHPTDKSSWTFEVTVPAGSTAVLNGRLAAVHETAETTTWTWVQSEPMASYLITFLVGDYEVIDAGRTDSGVEIVNVAVADRVGVIDIYDEVTRAQFAFFEELFGTYPFDRYGIALADSMPGLAMETQGLSLFSAGDFDGSLSEFHHSLLAHELAHQWFGDAVSPETWDDIWLNEGFATYGEWLWLEEIGRSDVDTTARTTARSLPVDGWPLAAPEEMFGIVSYQGGAVALHAIRLEIGDEAFFAGLRRWVDEYLDSAAGTEDFRAVMESVSGRDLGDVFETWIYADTVPDRLPDPTATRLGASADVREDGWARAARDSAPTPLG